MSAMSPVLAKGIVADDRGAYAFGGSGKFVDGSTMSAAEMMKEAGLDWQVVKRPISFRKASGSTKVIPSKFALVRETDENFLSLAGPVYKPVQNDKSFGFIDRFVRNGHMKMAAAGSLCGGQYIWGLAQVGDSFTLPGQDKVGGYLLLVNPHLVGRSLVVKHLSVRLFCWNQMPALLTGAKSQSGEASTNGVFRMPHSLNFDESTQDKAEEAVGLSRKALKEFQTKAETLVDAKCNADEATDYFQEILRVGPYAPGSALDQVVQATETRVAFDAILDATEKKATRRLPILVKMQEALLNSPGAAVPSAKGTMWGAFNAVTYVLDHQVCTDADRRLRDNWLGGRGEQKREALEIAMRRAA